LLASVDFTSARKGKYWRSQRFSHQRAAGGP
jgi:hypothetical protein